MSSPMPKISWDCRNPKRLVESDYDSDETIYEGSQLQKEALSFEKTLPQLKSSFHRQINFTQESQSIRNLNSKKHNDNPMESVDSDNESIDSIESQMSQVKLTDVQEGKRTHRSRKSRSYRTVRWKKTWDSQHKVHKGVSKSASQSKRDTKKLLQLRETVLGMFVKIEESLFSMVDLDLPRLMIRNECEEILAKTRDYEEMLVRLNVGLPDIVTDIRQMLEKIINIVMKNIAAVDELSQLEEMQSGSHTNFTPTSKQAPVSQSNVTQNFQPCISITNSAEDKMEICSASFEAYSNHFPRWETETYNRYGDVSETLANYDPDIPEIFKRQNKKPSATQSSGVDHGMAKTSANYDKEIPGAFVSGSKGLPLQSAEQRGAQMRDILESENKVPVKSGNFIGNMPQTQAVAEHKDASQPKTQWKIAKVDKELHSSETVQKTTQRKAVNSQPPSTSQMADFSQDFVDDTQTVEFRGPFGIKLSCRDIDVETRKATRGLATADCEGQATLVKGSPGSKVARNLPLKGNSPLKGKSPLKRKSPLKGKSSLKGWKPILKTNTGGDGQYKMISLEEQVAKGGEIQMSVCGKARSRIPRPLASIGNINFEKANDRRVQERSAADEKDSCSNWTGKTQAALSTNTANIMTSALKSSANPESLVKNLTPSKSVRFSDASYLADAADKVSTMVVKKIAKETSTKQVLFVDLESDNSTLMVVETQPLGLTPQSESFVCPRKPTAIQNQAVSASNFGENSNESHEPSQTQQNTFQVTQEFTQREPFPLETIAQTMQRQTYHALPSQLHPSQGQFFFRKLTGAIPKTGRNPASDVPPFGQIQSQNPAGGRECVQKQSVSSQPVGFVVTIQPTPTATKPPGPAQCLALEGTLLRSQAVSASLSNGGENSHQNRKQLLTHHMIQGTQDLTAPHSETSSPQQLARTISKIPQQKFVQPQNPCVRLPIGAKSVEASLDSYPKTPEQIYSRQAVLNVAQQRPVQNQFPLVKNASQNVAENALPRFEPIETQSLTQQMLEETQVTTTSQNQFTSPMQIPGTISKIPRRPWEQNIAQKRPFPNPDGENTNVNRDQSLTQQMLQATKDMNMRNQFPSPTKIPKITSGGGQHDALIPARAQNTTQKRSIQNQVHVQTNVGRNDFRSSPSRPEQSAIATLSLTQQMLQETQEMTPRKQFSSPVQLAETIVKIPQQKFLQPQNPGVRSPLVTPFDSALSIKSPPLEIHQNDRASQAVSSHDSQKTNDEPMEIQTEEYSSVALSSQPTNLSFTARQEGGIRHTWSETKCIERQSQLHRAAGNQAQMHMETAKNRYGNVLGNPIPVDSPGNEDGTGRRIATEQPREILLRRSPTQNATTSTYTQGSNQMDYTANRQSLLQMQTSLAMTHQMPSPNQTNLTASQQSRVPRTQTIATQTHDSNPTASNVDRSTQMGMSITSYSKAVRGKRETIFGNLRRKDERAALLGITHVRLPALSDFCPKSEAIEEFFRGPFKPKRIPYEWQKDLLPSSDSE